MDVMCFYVCMVYFYAVFMGIFLLGTSCKLCMCVVCEWMSGCVCMFAGDALYV